MQALIRYWTGTGNTARATAVVEATLVAAGWTVDRALVRFDSPVPSGSELAADLVVVACPALGFSAPSHFLRWLDGWPRGARGRAVVLGICGAEWGKKGIVPGWSGALLGQVSSRLKRCGLSVVGAVDHSYPVNWTQVMPPLPPKVALEVTQKADREVTLWTQSLVGRDGPGFGLALSSSSRWFIGAGAAVFRILGRRFLGKLYAADGSCTSCGLCERACPSGVIRMRGGRPVWNLDCDACNRCLNLCPPAAIQVTMARVVVHGIGNLGLAGVSLGIVGTWGWVAALSAYSVGSVVQLTLVDFVLGQLERTRVLAPLLTWGWTGGWGRYQASTAGGQK